MKTKQLILLIFFIFLSGCTTTKKEKQYDFNSHGDSIKNNIEKMKTPINNLNTLPDYNELKTKDIDQESEPLKSPISK